jgi:hypothetical protein
VSVSTDNRALADLIQAIESSQSGTREDAAEALGLVRDSVITGEGPTTRGRVHFSRELDAADAAWCRRILTAAGLALAPVSRAEVEALFEIDEAASERSDGGEFDDLFAKAVVHHAAASSGAKVPPRTIALSPDTAIESWAPTSATDIDTQVLEWLASQIRGKRRQNRTLLALIAALIGVAALPIAQSLPGIVDLGM